MSPDVQVMILAAGLGTRLWPLTADRGKPAVPFHGRPLILGIVEWLERSGFRRAVVNTHHLPQSIHRALERSPIPIAWSHEEAILGTAGCLEKALSEGLLEPGKPTLVVNGKLVLDIDLSPMFALHFARRAAVTMVLRPNTGRERFREVLRDGDQVIGFGEVPPAGPSPLLFTGIHLLSPDVLAAIPKGESDTIKDVYPPLIEAGRVYAHVDERGTWLELSTLARYLDLHGDRVVLSEGASIEPGAVVERSVLWEGATVAAGAEVRSCVLGRDVAIRSGERVEGKAIVLAAKPGDRIEVEIQSGR
jgi:NDP-sugar pyrophosphorylase family protein